MAAERRRRRAAPDVRREQMLRAAAALIGERGFSETRIADVARRVGRQPGAGHLLLRDQGPAAHRGAALLRGRVLRGVAAQLEELPTARAAARAARPAHLHPAGRRRDPRRVGAVVRPVGAGVPAPRGREGPHRARPALARHDRARRARRSGEPARSATSTPTSFAITFAALLDGLSIQVALEDPVVDPDRAFAHRDELRRRASSSVDWKPRRRSRIGCGDTADARSGRPSGSRRSGSASQHGRRHRRRAAAPPPARRSLAPGIRRRTARTAARPRSAPPPAVSARRPAAAPRAWSGRGRRRGRRGRGTRCGPAGSCRPCPRWRARCARAGR